MLTGRVDVIKGDALLVLVDELARLLPGEHPPKDGLAHHRLLIIVGHVCCCCCFCRSRGMQNFFQSIEGGEHTEEELNDDDGREVGDFVGGVAV